MIRRQRRYDRRVDILKETDVTNAKSSVKTISEELQRAVCRIDRPDDFCTSGRVPLVLPGLEVEGLGPIGLPLTASQAQDLKSRCIQAPYGKGEETLVDVRVRRVWHLKPDHFSLTNPDWSETLRSVVTLVQAGLGLKDQTLEAHLYDLLLYEEKGFFLPHRDGEKLDRMVATLVLVLPSAFEGGELVVRHDGQEQTIAFDGDARSSFQIQYAAFYADCEHEVKPLRRGHRLCLVYNLTLAKLKRRALAEKPSSSKAKALSKKVSPSRDADDSKATMAMPLPLTAPRISEHIAEIGRVLTAWSKSEGDTVPKKLAIRLEHKYTNEGLTWDALKGADRMKARALAEAAAQSGCLGYLALLTFWESGSSESYDDDDFGYGSRGRYGSRRRTHSRENDDEDDKATDGNIRGKYEMGEVYDESLTADRLSNIDGESLPVRTLFVEPHEIVPPDSLRSVKPEEDHEGYTGNEGMTLERWYRHAVILLWPDRNHFDVVCSCGSREAAKALLPLVARLRRANKSEASALRTQCHLFADRIIALWPENDHVGPVYDERRGLLEEDLGIGPKFLNALLELEDSDLVSAYLRKALARDASVDPGLSLVKACEAFGWTPFRDPLEEAFASSNAAMLSRNVRLLDHLGAPEESSGKAKGTRSKPPRTHASTVESIPARAEVCRSLATTLVSALKAFDAKKETYYYDCDLDRAALLIGLVRALVATNQYDLLLQVVSHALALEKKYPLIAVHVAALSQLAEWLPKQLTQPCAAVSDWIAAVSSQVAARTAIEPQFPTDFRRPATLTCKCANCKLVNTFLADPSSPAYRLRARQQIRVHVANEIRNTECDLTTTTDRKGSPQTLVCTKITASFERSLKTFQEDLKHLAMLQLLTANLPN